MQDNISLAISTKKQKNLLPSPKETTKKATCFSLRMDLALLLLK